MSKSKSKSFQINDGTISDEGYIRVSLVNQSVFVRKRRSCPLKEIKIEDINYKNISLISRFLTERGKIIPARVSGVVVKKQNALANAIKIARQLALISPVDRGF